jgi:hypothetical protein
MIQSATSFSNRLAQGLGACVLAGGLALPATAQVMPDPDAEEVAKTPLRDLNIDARDIPEPLRFAVRDPYETARMTSCNAIVADIAVLDQVLGADYDIAATDADGKKGLPDVNMGKLGQSVVGSIIPFRGIVREVSGAADSERLLRAAYTAGMARRSFLKGLGMGRGCKYPARPKPE